MRWMTRKLSIAVLLIFSLIALAPASAAQTVTTGTLSGTIVDPQGGALPGATVLATHTPTGTRYEGVTNSNGRFEIPNVRPGPYTVTATLSGFKDETQSAEVVLGEDKAVEFKLSLATLTEAVTVTAQAAEIAPQSGTAANISNELIESLPTIQRSITEVARTNPFFNATTNGGSGDRSLSVAGRHNRYNNILIDGAVNNDLFGLADSGTPGGQTGTQPISFDAMDQMQLVVAPYDVRQGGFSGGGVNIITKSGTNLYSGTAYYYARNQSWVGQIPAIATVANPSPADTAVGPFSDKQGGASFGGPIVKNKAFFFANVDFGRKTTPSGYSLDGSSGQLWNSNDTALAQEALQILQAKYGFNPGGLGEFGKPNNSDKVFVRGDFNLSPHNQLNIRTNYVNGLANVGTPSTTQYIMPDNYYSIQDKLSSTVGQLNTTISDRMVNEFRMTYQRDRNIRGDQPGYAPFPHVRVDFPDNNYMTLGTENNSQANKLNQDIIELNDDVTLLRGNHTFSLGTHNEFFKFDNLFIANYYGNYEFTNNANLQSGLAQFYLNSYSNDPNNPLVSAAFSVQQWGVYAGDQWRLRSDFTLTYGLRIDAPHFPDAPQANPVSVADFSIHTDVVPSPKMWSPRAGFTWDLSHGSDNRQQIRGGAGIFSGRTPYVWLSNQYINTGLALTTLNVPFSNSAQVPFSPDPFNQPRNVGTAGKQTINMIDPSYRYPNVARGNIAYDRSLGILGLIGSAEYVWSKTLDDIKYQNLNDIPNGTLPDGRYIYTKYDPNIVDALYLTNATSGSTNTITFSVQRPFKRGFFLSGSYLHNSAKSISDAPAFVALTSWRDQYVTKDVNDPPLATSIYQVGDRVQLTATVPVPLFKGLTSAASVYYNGQTGQPYTLVFNRDANNDQGTFNDIAFLPSDPSQVVVANGTYAQLDAYLNAESAAQGNRGIVPLRNTGVSPWTNDLDFRYAVKIPTGGRTRVDLTLDIFNVLNMLNNSWGLVYFPNFNSPTTLTYGGIDKATGKEIIDIKTITSTGFQGTFTRDDLRSRWTAQWGARITF